jgi:iron complex outermembrane receptor protein
VVALPAGSLRMRSAVQRDFDRSRTISDTGAGSDVRRYSRAATRFDGGIDIPLASRRQGFLAALGELTLSLDGGYHAVDNLPNLDRSAISTLWQPTERLSLSGSITKTEELPLIELLTDPVVIYDNVRILDFLSGETVDVRAVTGGNPGLSPLSKTARRASVSAALWQKYNLQLNLDYESTTVRNHVGAVPASSSAVFLAFPERFQRDADGRLVLIDTRAVNFDRQRREDLRYGVSFTLPVGRPSAAEPGTGAPAGRSRTRLQVNASHTYALQNDIVYRPGLPVVDLLRGGAVGFGVTQPRHFVNGSVALSGPGYGLRLNGAFRSASTLQSGSLAAPEELRFASLLTANLRTFVELDSIWPTSMVLKQTRVSLGIDNLANRRQRVTDASGTVPLRFQPAYRDAVGRTLQIELRKVL